MKQPLSSIVLCLLLVALPVAKPQTGAAAPTGTPSAELALANRDLAALAQVVVPARNLYDLTRRLKLHSSTPIDPYIRQTAPDYAIGRADTFWVSRATSGYFSMRAVLLFKTAHAYWYVQQGIGIDPTKLLTLLRTSAHDFEAHVYPTNRAAFGTEWTPGIDRDPHITVLCADLPGVGGYYNSADLYPRAVNPFSNQRKMLYVSITSYPLGTPDFASVIAHEFQHMIHWHQHQNDDTWINEGSSVLAQVLNGYTPDGQDAAFAAVPGTQLDTFCYGAPYCDSNTDYAYYGAAFQWMYYFYQHYGGRHALRTLLSDRRLSGMLLFDEVLARLGSHDRARDMFAKWVIANYVDDPTLDGGIYGYRPTYQGCCLHAALTATTSTYPYTRSASVDQFTTAYIEMKPRAESTLRLQFRGTPTVAIVANHPLHGATEWWSNRGDEMDTTLTRAVDLSALHHATLHYDLWYDVEDGFDYGYVEVSTDGGSTWQTLHGRYTTASNPNGTNLGSGYTGMSLHQPGNKGGWLHEALDLSAYAGRQIQVRFEHITDDVYNRPGLTLDAIRIPELGARQVLDDGWVARGWVRISNLLPTRWVVQAILYTTHGITVRPMPLLADGTGALTVSGFGTRVRRVVLAISPTAPQTTVPASYTLTVHR